MFNYLLSNYPPTAGRSDLVAYFFRRAFDLINKEGFFAFISTNTISQGDTRSGALEAILEKGAKIGFAIRSIRWPGLAAVRLSLLAITNRQIKQARLDSQDVTSINSFLDEAGSDTNAQSLAQNESIGFLGSYLYGEGFILKPDEAKRILQVDPRNRDIIFPYLMGKDINQQPDQSASRFVINFSIGIELKHHSIRCASRFSKRGLSRSEIQSLPRENKFTKKIFGSFGTSD